MPTLNGKIKISKVMQSLCTAKPKKSNSGTFIYIYLVETFASILNSKIVFKKLFWLKLSILKNSLQAHNSLIPGGNKQTHILKHKPTPLSCRFV